MNNNFGKYIKNKILNYTQKYSKKKSEIIKELGITTQYLNDIENGKRIPSADLMKKIINLLELNEAEKIELYDLASNEHKKKKIPADIEEYILNNKEAKNKIRKMIMETEK